MADQPDAPRRPRVGFQARVLGTGERIGLWTLPFFLVVGLTGAVLAGTIAVVWYSQQVTALRDEIADARSELRDAVDRVQEAGDEALAAIAGEVDSVQEALTRNLPVSSADEVGLVLIRAFPTVSDDGSTAGGSGSGGQGASTQPQPTSSEPASPQPSGRRLQESPPPQEPGDTTPEQEEPQPAPSATASGPVRVGSAFAVAREGTATFFVTSYSLVADEASPGGTLETVEVVTAAGPVEGTVHAWDELRDLALVRAEAGQVIIAPWRPSDEPLAAGERVIAAGLTSAQDLLRVGGTVSLSDVTALVDDLDTPATLVGGPVLDLDGRVVAIRSATYSPIDGVIADVPVGLLCERLIRNCEANEADSGADADEGPADG